MGKSHNLRTKGIPKYCAIQTRVKIGVASSPFQNCSFLPQTDNEFAFEKDDAWYENDSWYTTKNMAENYSQKYKHMFRGVQF